MKALLEAMLLSKHQLLYDTYIYIYIYVCVCVCVCDLQEKTYIIYITI